MTSSFKFWQKPKSKDSFKEVSDFDLFYQLTYMSAVASAGISRTRIFQLSSKVPRPPAEYFERVHLLTQKLGYDYAKACRTVGDAIRSSEMKSLLLRLAGALISGQPEADFLTEEALVQGDAYEKEYERDLASLTKWTDAYAAISVSAALIVIVNLTSTLIYDMGMGMIIGLTAVSVLTSSMGAWVLSKAAPREVRAFFSAEGPGAQRLARSLVRIVPPAVLIVCLPLWLLGAGLGQILVVAALLVSPLGLVSMLAGREIDAKDREIGPFLRSLGGMAMSTGTTITEALTRVDLSSFPPLESDLNRLRWRLNASIDPELCWRKFAHETGSKLIGETVAVFNDAVKLGGDPDTVAFLSAQFASKTIMLRAKRKVVSSTFSWLTMVMHGAIAALMITIMEIIRKFTDLVGTAVTIEDEASMGAMMPMMISFGSPHTQFLQLMTTGMVILLALVNAYAIISADGGHKFKLSYYLAILLLLSGASFLVMPSLVEMIM